MKGSTPPVDGPGGRWYLRGMMPARALARVLTRALVLAIPLFLSAAAWAQEGAAPRAPTLGRSQPVWVGFAFMFLMLAAVVAVNIMPSKRSHQD